MPKRRSARSRRRASGARSAAQWSTKRCASSAVRCAACANKPYKGGAMAKGIGGMGNLLKQAQDMQTRISKIQEELGQKTVEGSAGGGMVQVTVNGHLNLTAIKIEASVINANEKDMLED